MDIQPDEARAKSVEMKWVSALIKKHNGSITDAAKAIGEPYQYLQYLSDPKKARTIRQLMNRLRKARIALGMSHKAFYEEIEEEVEQEFKK